MSLLGKLSYFLFKPWADHGWYQRCLTINGCLVWFAGIFLLSLFRGCNALEEGRLRITQHEGVSFQKTSRQSWDRSLPRWDSTQSNVSRVERGEGSRLLRTILRGIPNPEDLIKSPVLRTFWLKEVWCWCPKMSPEVVGCWGHKCFGRESSSVLGLSFHSPLRWHPLHLPALGSAARAG